MSQAYSMRQLRKQGDSVAETAREVEASRSAVRSNLAKNDLSLPGYPLRPPVRARDINARGSAIVMLAPNTDWTGADIKMRHIRLKQTPLATSGRFRRPNRPETPPSADVPPGRRSRQRTTPAKNRTEVQDPWRNRRPFPAKPPRSRGARPRARPRQPPTPTRAQPSGNAKHFAHFESWTRPEKRKDMARAVGMI